MKSYKKKLEHSTLDENSFYFIKKSLPWSLRIENRLGSSTVSFLFLEGQDNCDNVTLCDPLCRGFPGWYKENTKSMYETINTEMLWVEFNPSQWSFPVSENQKEEGTLRLNNNRIIIIIDKLDKLKDMKVIDNGTKILWKRFIDNLKKAIKKCTKKKTI